MRREFSKATKAAAFKRANGICECGCNLPLVGRPEYHHDQEDFIGGVNSLENCRCVNKKCHRRITDANRPQMDKTRRIVEKNAGLRRGRGFRGSRRFDGTVRWKT